MVHTHSNASFIGHRKHLTWIRDLNRNFIDDGSARLVRRARKSNKSDQPVSVTAPKYWANTGEGQVKPNLAGTCQTE